MNNVPRDTGPAKLPGLPAVSTDNASLAQWIQAATERFEVREGARGNPYERVMLARDLGKMGLPPADAPGSTGVLVRQPDGRYAAQSVDAFADSIRATRLYADLLKKLDDVTRFDGMPSQVRELLLNDLALEAARRGADIRQLEFKLQTEVQSLAYTVQEVTAATKEAQAGVREVTYASVEAGRATAGKVTQLTAALDGTGSATIEQSLVVIADRTAGLSAQAMLKLNAGGAIASIGLMATEDRSGATQSAVLIQADKFAIVAPGYTGGPTLNPASNLIPFGVDASGVFINGTLRVNTGGTSLQVLAANAAVAPITFVGDFASAPATSTYKKNNVYRNTTDGNTYILSADAGSWSLYLAKGTAGATGSPGNPGSPGATGSPGNPGSPGTRGSMTFYASGSFWSDSTADNAVASVTGSYAKTIGDTVTISSGNFAATKYWSGGSWVDPGVTINGNLLVTGTVSAGTGAFNKAILGYSGLTSRSNLYVSDGSVLLAVNTTKIGTPLYAWAATLVGGVTLGLQWYDYIDATQTAYFKLTGHATANGDAWTGTVGTLNVWVY